MPEELSNNFQNSIQLRHQKRTYTINTISTIIIISLPSLYNMLLSLFLSSSMFMLYPSPPPPPSLSLPSFHSPPPPPLSLFMLHPFYICSYLLMLVLMHREFLRVSQHLISLDYDLQCFTWFSTGTLLENLSIIN